MISFYYWYEGGTYMKGLFKNNFLAVWTNAKIFLFPKSVSIVPPRVPSVAEAVFNFVTCVNPSFIDANKSNTIF